MSTELVIIPQELESMSASLPNEKKNEIVSAVKNVFENVQKMRVQLEAINVADENDKVKFTAYLCLKAADGTIVNGWLASQSDMLSNDWIVL